MAFSRARARAAVGSGTSASPRLLRKPMAAQPPLLLAWLMHASRVETSLSRAPEEGDHHVGGEALMLVGWDDFCCHLFFVAPLRAGTMVSGNTDAD